MRPELLRFGCSFGGTENKNIVSVGVRNAINHGVTLQRDVNIGTCQPVMEVTRIEENFINEKQHEVFEDKFANFYRSHQT